ncbi:MAG: phosphotransferase [Candidatus Cloacimonetes bacterium]|nr:phosphotransferase [Candidatus Cloacimonadota bacterium]
MQTKPTPIFRKQCETELEFWKELSIYRSKLSYTPRLLGIGDDHTLILEAVDGVPYLDFLPIFDARLLGRTISSFHRTFQVSDRKTLCHHDNQPGNILYSGTQYYLIDFSEIQVNFPEHDISHLFLFWSEEFNLEQMVGLSRDFLEEYLVSSNLAQDKWNCCLSENLIRFDRRRARYCKPLRKNESFSAQNREFLKSLELSSFH